MNLKPLVIGILSCSVVACSTTEKAMPGTSIDLNAREGKTSFKEIHELNELLNKSIKSLEDELNGGKGGGKAATQAAAVKQVGTEAGIYNGRRWRQKQINSWLVDMNNMLSLTFNFEQVLIDGVYLPPRVDEIKGHVEKMDDGSLKVIRQGYRIASSPTLIVTPPTYLNYLYQIVDPEKPVNRFGLPEMNSSQVPIWQKAVLDGWQIGVRQADIEFTTDLNLLKRDYGGMLRYIDLVEKGMISKPKIVNKAYGVMISANGKELNVGDEIITIGRTPTFQHHDKWEVLEEGGQ